MAYTCRSLLMLPAMLAIAGCTSPFQHAGKSLLSAARMSPGSVAVDVFFVRFPFGDSEVNGRLWDQIDEQCLPPEVRNRLACNGFRAGVISGQMPVELSRLLELDGKPVPDGKMEEATRNNLMREPNVVRSHMQMPVSERREIAASDVCHEALPVLVCQNGQVTGETYSDAQGLFGVKSSPLPDGRVRLELVPELHYGQSRRHAVAEQGILRMDFSRPKCVYNDMKIAANLTPGNMLVLGSIPDRPGSLGHHFFTEKGGQPKQKLLVIVLSQTQPSDVYSTSAPLIIPEDDASPVIASPAAENDNAAAAQP